MHKAVTDFLSTSHDCLLLVHWAVRRLEQAASELLSVYDWTNLRLGQELSAVLLSETPRRRPHEARRWMKARLGEMSPGPVLCSEIDLLFEPTLELDPLSLMRDVSRVARMVVACVQRQ